MGRGFYLCLVRRTRHTQNSFLNFVMPLYTQNRVLLHRRVIFFKKILGTFVSFVSYYSPKKVVCQVVRLTKVPQNGT